MKKVYLKNYQIQPHSLIRAIDLSNCESKIKGVGHDITATKIFLLTTYRFLDFSINGLRE